MRIEASCNAISGRVNAPSSKSAMQRYIAGALLARGRSTILSPSFCDDSMAAIGIARDLGAKVTIAGESVIVEGGFHPVKDHISCGESGLATRMFTPIAAIHSGEITINGKGSVLKRPLKMMELPMSELGVEIFTSNGYLPVRIKGPLKGGDVYTDGSVSSQFITGLLMALPVVRNDSIIFVDNLVSRPYIDLTLSILNDFGIKVLNHGYEKFEISGRQKYTPGDYRVEGDWSGAAFLLVMAAIAGDARVMNLDPGSHQADKVIFEIISRAGAKINFSDESVKVTKGDLSPLSFDITDCPDLAPPLVVLALASKGRSIITGTSRLTSKESDRGKILESTLSQLGAKIWNYPDRIEIEGGSRLKGGTADANGDHRIAMALAAVSLLCDSPVIINGFECVNKSYPRFADDFRTLGGEIVVI
jgi:3-phosphoshikimate 1-carboxyvinyltransferase